MSRSDDRTLIPRCWPGLGPLASKGVSTAVEFESAPAIDAKTVRELFEAKVFSMLLEKGLIGHELVEKIRSVEAHGVRRMDWPSDHRHEGDRADRYVHSASAGGVRSTDRR